MAADIHMRGDATLALQALAAAVPERAADWRSEALAARMRETPDFRRPNRAALTAFTILVRQCWLWIGQSLRTGIW